jgi:hypothetical protein
MFRPASNAAENGASDVLLDTPMASRGDSWEHLSEQD